MKVFSLNISPLKLTMLVVLFFNVNVVLGQKQGLSTSNSSGPDEKVKVEIFPNPTSEFLNIDLTKLDLKKPQVEIRSIIGTIMNVQVEENGRKKYKVDVQSFPRGYYLVLVRDDQSKFQQTIRFSKK